MRLIDADALYRKIKAECNPYGKPSIGWEDGKRVMTWIEQAPTLTIINKVCLCKSCTYNYPDCPAEIDSVVFGDDVGCDNICCCNQYEPILEKDFERGGYK